MSCVWRETTRKDRAWPWETEKESEKVLAFGEKSVPRGGRCAPNSGVAEYTHSVVIVLVLVLY